MKPFFDNSIELKNIGIARYQNGMMLYNIKNKSADLLLNCVELFALPYSVYLLDMIGANLGNVLLTPREKECLEYTVKGFTAKQVAKKLLISPRTVEEYLNQLKLKLGVCTKQQMIQKVLT